MQKSIAQIRAHKRRSISGAVNVPSEMVATKIRGPLPLDSPIDFAFTPFLMQSFT